MGFRRVGSWSIEGDVLKLGLAEHSNDKNILYAFVCSGAVTYIGKTVQPLKRRLYGYQFPVATQSTNLKGHSFIKAALLSSSDVEIYALPDNGLLYYGGFHVNLAAGLEDSLVSILKPAWNRAGI